jgi:phospholipid/cholesterol/gamma-HCH transport system permease protein
MSALSELGSSYLKSRKLTLETWGDQLMFYIKALAWTPRVLRQYRKETAIILAEVVFGVGALSVIAGTVGVIAFLAFFVRVAEPDRRREVHRVHLGVLQHP